MNYYNYCNYCNQSYEGSNKNSDDYGHHDDY